MATGTITRLSTKHYDPLADIITSLGRISLGPSLPDWSLVDSPEAVSYLVNTLISSIELPESGHHTPPSLYIDFQRSSPDPGHPSLLQIYVLPRHHTYIIDIQTLGQAAFDTPSCSWSPFGHLSQQPTPAINPTSTTIRTILQSPVIPKVFFEVRTAATALHTHFDIALEGVHDLQLMELASRAITNKQNTSPILPTSSSKNHSKPPTPIPTPASSSPRSQSPSPYFNSSPTSSTSSTSTSSSSIYTTKPATRPRRSLSYLNTLPRCIIRDASLSLTEQLAWDKWQAFERQERQIHAANRELERLSRWNNGGGSGGGGGDTKDGYELYKTSEGLENRPLSEGVLRLCVLNVRYLGRLWAVYDTQIRGGGGDGDRDVENKREKGEVERIWRERVGAATMERVDGAKGSLDLGKGSGWCNRIGRGKLALLSPLGWDVLV